MHVTSPETRLEEILAAIRRHESVRVALPGGGVLSIDRGLPFLLVHRRAGEEEDAGTARLVSGEASYLLGGDDPEGGVAPLVAAVAEAASVEFGAFLVLELWAAADPHDTRFVLHAPDGPASETVETLLDGLAGLRDLHGRIEVEHDGGDARHPPGLPPLLSVHESWEAGILLLGLQVPPVYRQPETGRVYPRFLRRLQHRLSDVLRQSLFEFVRVQTTCRVENYRALGTRAVPDAIWEADRELSAIEHAFDFLLLTSPVNDESAWERFRESGFQRPPELHYRLLPVDPDLLKRRLFAIRMEEIDDPALSSLFQDKRQELDRQLSMLDERRTPDFLYSSMRLYGAVDDRLLAEARELLARVPPATRRPPGRRPEPVDAWSFHEAAAREVTHYAAHHPPIAERRIVVRPDLVGLMVSEGNLLIGEGLRLDPARVPALLHHEVGTHVLTYVNGAAQPMEQLSLGLADYDELQEGLAVLAEYLVGGLDRSRMRLLAARVLAAHSVEEGAGFVETFRLLHAELGFSPRGAWHVAARVHRCGGFTRDLIYLRGLIALLDHLAEGGALEPLYVGKIALRHLPIIDELRHRSVLREPPLRPRVLDHPDALGRLEAVRARIPLPEMVCPERD